MVGTMEFGADAVSSVIGRVRLEDMLAQVGGSAQFVVAALDQQGVVVFLELRFADSWGATSWRRQLECPCCFQPARVLHVRNGIATCGRCLPRVTAHHRQKNTASWRREGLHFDQVMRQIHAPRRKRAPSLRSLTRRVEHAVQANAKGALDAARTALRATDGRVARSWPPAKKPR